MTKQTTTSSTITLSEDDIKEAIADFVSKKFGEGIIKVDFYALPTQKFATSNVVADAEDRNRIVNRVIAVASGYSFVDTKSASDN